MARKGRQRMSTLLVSKSSYVCKITMHIMYSYSFTNADIDKHLINCGELKAKVRVSFIVLATLWGLEKHF